MDDDTELSDAELASFNEYNRKIEILKNYYIVTYKNLMESDPTMVGNCITLYKNQLYCTTLKCTSFAAALDVFQDEVGEDIDDVFYITRVGHSDESERKKAFM